MRMPTDADVLLIGSGAGGLGAALALARAGLRVTICEAHEIPGGYSQSFTLEGLRFSPGIHYIGELGPGEPLRRIYEGLGLGGELEFAELAPRSYVHITLGQRTYPLVKGRAALEAHLAEEFPGEAAGIAGYLDQVQRIGRVLRGDGLQLVTDRAALGGLGPWAHRTGQRLIEAHVGDSTLRGLFGAIAGEYGLAPSLAPATVHALTVCHYLEGAYYPRGGGGGLVKAMVRAFKRAGGQLRLSAPVARILTDQHRVAGVELLDGTRLHARHVVSNADPGVTWRSLLAGHPAAEAARERLSRARWSLSTLSFFLALDRSPAAWGLDSGNHWLFPDEDVDGAFRSIAGASLETLADGPLFLSFPTLKDPSLPRGGRHTLEAFTFAPWPLFHRWHDTTPEARGPEYEAFKRRALDRVLSRAEYLLPGLRDHLVFENVATPVTSAHFVRASQGHMYGLEKNPLQVGGGSFPVRPGVEGLDGLWLCGAGTLTHGIHGATLSGLVAAAGILGVRVADLLTGDRPIAVHPSDDLSAWPPELQQEIRSRDPASRSPLPV
jgi:phytoene dehydrogenase-like protein